MTDLLAGLGFRERRAVRRLLEPRAFESGDELITQGAAGAEFMVLLDGSTEISVDGESVHVAQPGEFFGELALLPDISRSNGRRLATVTAAETAEVGVCGRVAFTHLMEQHTQVGGRIVAQAWALTGWVHDRRPDA
ncbi:MAG: cyclic nucleotide-binding domain-containing protein [Actinomycetota bacterium]